MLTINKIWTFLKEQWLTCVIIIVLVFMQVQADAKVAIYKEALKQLEVKIEQYKKSDEKLRHKIDSLSSLEKEVIREIKTIKEKEYVQIKVVDSLPISELQQFFTDRYPSGNPN
jgi:septal ring factor EnvC (AmiA/AmiB activator)